MSESNITKGLKLLDDALFDPETQEDAFGHKTYANLLTRIFNPASGNRPGLSVALFGRWGQGKSSVVRMLQSNFAKQNSVPDGTSPKVNIIWFNAWKSRGDYVRRQLLLSIIKGINSPRYDNISKFVQPGNPLIMRPYDVQKEVSDRADCWLLCKKLRLSKFEAGAILVGVFLFSLWIVSQCSPQWSAKLSTIPLTGFMAACFAFVWKNLSQKRESILTSAEPVSDSQRLKYPDQFQLVFEEELADYKKRDDRPIVVVLDDLDRCEAATVVEALACIRQLGGKPVYKEDIADCRFLVPCDEDQVISALTADGHHSGYEEDELLRKFFDVVIRMDMFVPEDMVSYALEAIPEDAGLTPDNVEAIQELIGAVAPRNPREVKKLINAFLLSRAKLEEAREGRTFREATELPHLLRTQLLVIALQETVPDVYLRAVEDPELLKTLLQTDPAEKPVAKERKAKQILRALQPVSMRTFGLLVRKGLPETLRSAEYGAELYDSVISGDVEAFSQTVSQAADLSHVIAWLKQYKTTLHSTAQLRHVLACVGATKDLTPKLFNVVEDYLVHPRLGEALAGFDGIVDLSRLSTKLKRGKRELHKAILTNFRALKDDDVLAADELTALLTCSPDLTDEAKSLCASKVGPLFNTSEVQAARDRLVALNKQLDRVERSRYIGVMPQLALTIARQCSWGFHSTKTPEEGKDLHARPISELVGENEENIKKLIAILFGKEGPLAAPINLQQDSNKGQYEALLTLQKLAARLPQNVAQDLYTKLKPWTAAQPPNLHAGFRHVCNAIRDALFKLSDEQLKEFAVLLVDRTKPADDPEWLCKYVAAAPKEGDAHKRKYAAFCKAIFNSVAETQLTTNAIPDPLKKLLAGMTENGWDVAAEADTVLAKAINRITDAAIWEVWKTSLWPLCDGRCPKTTQAAYDRIKANVMPTALITFAVRDVCKNQLTHALQTTLKDYFKLPSSLSNETFVALFSDDNVDGADTVLEFVINSLSLADVGLDDEQMEFLAQHCPRSSRDALFKCLRVHYLEDSESGAFSTGIRYVDIMGDPPQNVLHEIRKHATEQAVTLPENDKEIIVRLLGEDIFTVAKEDDSESDTDAEKQE